MSMVRILLRLVVVLMFGLGLVIWWVVSLLCILRLILNMWLIYLSSVMLLYMGFDFLLGLGSNYESNSIGVQFIVFGGWVWYYDGCGDGVLLEMYCDLLFWVVCWCNGRFWWVVKRGFDCVWIWYLLVV